MVESLTYCAICFEEYEKEERIPLMLSCGHTFCKNCLILLPEPPKCPACRTPETKSINELPRNILIFQIQAQIKPSDTEPCSHSELLFYCKVCKYPICLECVVLHSNHGLLSLKDDALNAHIKIHLDQIRQLYQHRTSECKSRKELAEEMISKLDKDYTKNREVIVQKFKEMQRLVESQEQQYLERITELYRKMITKNERDDNISEHLQVSVSVDQSWLSRNLKKLGNIGVINPNRQEFQVRRSQNVKALNWKYSGRIDAITFRVDREIWLTGIGVCTPYKLYKLTKINEMKVLKGNTTRSDVIYLHSNSVCLMADFVSGVNKVPFETIVRLEPESDYTIYLKISGAKTVKCVDSLITVKGRDGTNFQFSNTVFVQGDESNRTDVQCGPIVDFCYLTELEHLIN